MSLPTNSSTTPSKPVVPILNKTLKKKSLILEDGNVYKIQKVRQRKILSCIPCHQRKIKCSRGEICDHCLKNNLSCQRFINDSKLGSMKKHENRNNNNNGNNDGKNSENDKNDDNINTDNSNNNQGKRSTSRNISTNRSTNSTKSKTLQQSPKSKKVDRIRKQPIEKKGNKQNRSSSSSSPRTAVIKASSVAAATAKVSLSERSVSPSPSVATPSVNQEVLPTPGSDYTPVITTSTEVLAMTPLSSPSLPPSPSLSILMKEPELEMPPLLSMDDHDDIDGEADVEIGDDELDEEENLSEHHQLSGDLQVQQQEEQETEEEEDEEEKDGEEYDEQEGEYTAQKMMYVNSEKSAGNKLMMSSPLSSVGADLISDASPASQVTQQTSVFGGSGDDFNKLHQRHQHQHYQKHQQQQFPQDRHEEKKNYQSRSSEQGGRITRGDAKYELSPKALSIFQLIEPVVRDLPTRQVSEFLLSTYVISVSPLFPIVDIMSFKLKHEVFWNAGLNELSNVESLFLNKQCFAGFENVNELLEFLWIYLAILFASKVAQFEEQPVSLKDLVAEYQKYKLDFTKLNDIFCNNFKQLDTLLFQVNLLVLSFSDLTSDKSMVSVTKLIRIAQYYRIDHDPVIHKSLNNKCLVQLNRLMWWKIFELDDIVSTYQFLPSSIKLSEFDTCLPLEDANQLLPTIESNISSPISAFCNYTICYLNSKSRYFLLENELNRLSNGLNSFLNDEDISNMKCRINDLYIFCYSSIVTVENTAKKIRAQLAQSDSDKNCNNKNNNNNNNSNNTVYSSYLYQQLRFIEYAKIILNILADKILIKLQIKILATPSTVMNKAQYQYRDKFYNNITNRQPLNFSDTATPNGHHSQQQPLKDNLKLQLMLLNLNLKMNKNVTNYTYNDLSNNLLASLLHTTNEFINLYETRMDMGENLSCYNWELRNYLPAEEIILLTTILVVNLKHKQQDLDDKDDIQLKVNLIDRCMEILLLNWSDKLPGMNKTMRILDSLWTLIKYKYHLKPNLQQFRVPQPSLSPSLQSIPSNQKKTTISFSEIAPRTMRGHICAPANWFPMVDFADDGETSMNTASYLMNDSNSGIDINNNITSSNNNNFGSSKKQINQSGDDTIDNMGRSDCPHDSKTVHYVAEQQMNLGLGNADGSSGTAGLQKDPDMILGKLESEVEYELQMMEKDVDEEEKYFKSLKDGLRDLYQLMYTPV